MFPWIDLVGLYLLVCLLWFVWSSAVMVVFGYLTCDWFGFILRWCLFVWFGCCLLVGGLGLRDCFLGDWFAVVVCVAC